MASNGTGSSGGWGNIPAILLLGSLYVSLALGVVSFVDFLEAHATSQADPEPVRSTYGPDIRHCFEPDAPELWDCITYKD